MPKSWPEDVKPISLDQLDHLGIDPRNRLYWNGRPVQLQTRLRFTRLQKWLAISVGVATIIGGLGTGLNEGFDLLHKLIWGFS